MPRGNRGGSAARPRIAFFGYHDVFEDFFPHYGVSQEDFATAWASTGTHSLLALIQQELADVTWYELSLEPQLTEARHQLGFRVRILRSPTAHRLLWRAFYTAPGMWRWQHRYRLYEAAASYLAPISWPLARALREDRPDLILSQDYATGRFDAVVAAGRLLGAGVAAIHAGSAPERYSGLALKRITLRLADRLVASSRGEEQMLVDRFGVDAKRVSVVLTPIDTELFHPRARRGTHEIGPIAQGRRYVIFIGRLVDDVKRVSSLIRAYGALAGEHGDTDLVIVGDGPDAAGLRELAQAEAPGRICFLGWIRDRGRLAQLLSSAQALALPSRSEGFPTVVGEAMACGTPVLATRAGGVSELVVSGRTGWLVEPGDDEALRSALSEAMAEPSAARALGAQARKVAEERLAPAAVAEQLRAVLPLPRGEEVVPGG